MCVMACINLVLDIATVYFITHDKNLYTWHNVIAHKLFLLSIGAISFCLLLYVLTLGQTNRRMKKWVVALLTLPLLVSATFLVFADIEFNTDGALPYSKGVAVDITFFVIALYLLMSFCATLYFGEAIKRRKKRAIQRGVIVIAMAAAIQNIFSEILLSGLAVGILIFLIYLSFENPKEYKDEELGCFNNKAFYLMLTEMFAIGKKFCIVNVVFDDLQTVYNCYGHDLGDCVLIESIFYLKTRLKTRVYFSENNTLRMMLPITKDEAEIQLEKLESRFQFPFFIESATIMTQIHIEILECKTYAATVNEVNDILEFLANNRIRKETDKSCIYIIGEEYIAMKRRYVAIEKLLQDALDHDGFEILYQPIFSATEQRMISAEALVRLKDTTSIGYVSPEEFIPIAEKRGMILALGDVVLKKVCQFMADNQIFERYQIQYVEINVSALQAVDPEFSVRFHKILRMTGISPDCINLEITETATAEASQKLLDNIQLLKGIGCSFSMDDFGTGYSNLSQMAEIDYDLIKIDKSLIWPCFDKNIEKEKMEKAMVLLSNIITLVQKLDSGIVAEGVETEEMARVLTELNVKYLQGFYFSKPISEKEFKKYVQRK